MMNKLILFLMIVALFCTLFAGCGNNNVPGETTGFQVATGVDQAINETIVNNELTNTQNNETSETIANNELTNTQNNETNETIANTESINTQDNATNATKPDIDEITFTDFSEMSAEDQKEIVDSFDEMDDFFEWYDEIVQEDKKNPETTEPSPIFPDVPDVTVPQKDELGFLDYHAMSADEQKAFINTFESIDKFVEWHAAAKKAYDDSLIDIGLDGKPIEQTEPTGND